MTATVVSELERIERNDQIAAFNKAEAELGANVVKDIAETISSLPEKLLAPKDEHLRDVFVSWCASHAVRSCATRPSTVAAFILDNKDDARLASILAEITALHDKH